MKLQQLDELRAYVLGASLGELANHDDLQAVDQRLLQLICVAFRQTSQRRRTREALMKFFKFAGWEWRDASARFALIAGRQVDVGARFGLVLPVSAEAEDTAGPAARPRDPAGESSLN